MAVSERRQQKIKNLYVSRRRLWRLCGVSDVTLATPGRKHPRWEDGTDGSLPPFELDSARRYMKLFRVSLHRRGSEECTRRLTWSERRRPEGYRRARTATAKVTTAGVQQAFVPGKHERIESTAGCEARPVRRESRRVRRNRWVENFVHEVDSISRRSSFLELNSRREDENF